MFFKGLKVKDLENNIYTIINCEDTHNLELTFKTKDDLIGSAIWCIDTNCEDYDGELIPINLNKIRKKKLKQLLKINEKLYSRKTTRR